MQLSLLIGWCILGASLLATVKTQDCFIRRAASCIRSYSSTTFTTLEAPHGWNRTTACRSIQQSRVCIENYISNCEPSESAKERHLVDMVHTIAGPLCSDVFRYNGNISISLPLPSVLDGCIIHMATHCFSRHIADLIEESNTTVCSKVDELLACSVANIGVCLPARSSLLYGLTASISDMKQTVCGPQCDVPLGQGCLDRLWKTYRSDVIHDEGFVRSCCELSFTRNCLAEYILSCTSPDGEELMQNFHRLSELIQPACDTYTHISNCYYLYSKSILSVLNSLTGELDAENTCISVPKSTSKTQTGTYTKPGNDTTYAKSNNVTWANSSMIDCQLPDVIYACSQIVTEFNCVRTDIISNLPDTLKRVIAEILAILQAIGSQVCDGLYSGGRCRMAGASECLLSYLWSVIDDPYSSSVCYGFEAVVSCVSEHIISGCGSQSEADYRIIVEHLRSIKSYVCIDADQCRPTEADQCLVTLMSIMSVMPIDRTTVCRQASLTLSCVSSALRGCPSIQQMSVTAVINSMSTIFALLDGSCPEIRLEKWFSICRTNDTVDERKCDMVVVEQCKDNYLYKLTQFVFDCSYVSELAMCVLMSGSGCTGADLSTISAFHDQALGDTSAINTLCPQVNVLQLAAGFRCSLGGSEMCIQNYAETLVVADFTQEGFCKFSEDLVHCVTQNTLDCDSITQAAELNKVDLTFEQFAVKNFCPDMSSINRTSSVATMCLVGPCRLDKAASCLQELWNGGAIDCVNMHERVGTCVLPAIRGCALIPWQIILLSSANGQVLSLIADFCQANIADIFSSVAVYTPDFISFNAESIVTIVIELIRDKVDNTKINLAMSQIMDIINAIKADMVELPTVLQYMLSLEIDIIRDLQSRLRELMLLLNQHPIEGGFPNCDVFEAARCLERPVRDILAGVFSPIQAKEKICIDLYSVNDCVAGKLLSCGISTQYTYKIIITWLFTSARVFCVNVPDVRISVIADSTCLLHEARTCAERLGDIAFNQRYDRQLLCSQITEELACVGRFINNCPNNKDVGELIVIEEMMQMSLAITASICPLDITIPSVPVTQYDDTQRIMCIAQELRRCINVQLNINSIPTPYSFSNMCNFVKTLAGCLKTSRITCQNLPPAAIETVLDLTQVILTTFPCDFDNVQMFVMKQLPNYLMSVISEIISVYMADQPAIKLILVGYQQLIFTGQEDTTQLCVLVQNMIISIKQSLLTTNDLPAEIASALVAVLDWLGSSTAGICSFGGSSPSADGQLLLCLVRHSIPCFQNSFMHMSWTAGTLQPICKLVKDVGSCLQSALTTCTMSMNTVLTIKEELEMVLSITDLLSCPHFTMEYIEQVTQYLGFDLSILQYVLVIPNLLNQISDVYNTVYWTFLNPSAGIKQMCVKIINIAESIARLSWLDGLPRFLERKVRDLLAVIVDVTKSYCDVNGHMGRLACSSCQNSTSHDECDRRPAVSCDSIHQVCATITIGSNVISKGCMSPTLCENKCHYESGKGKICIECCDGPLCNKWYQQPRNGQMPVIPSKPGVCDLGQAGTCMFQGVTGILMGLAGSMNGMQSLVCRQVLPVMKHSKLCIQQQMHGCPDVFQWVFKISHDWMSEVAAGFCDLGSIPDRTGCHFPAALECITTYALNVSDIQIRYGKGAVCSFVQSSLSELINCVKSHTYYCSEVQHKLAFQQLSLVISSTSTMCDITLPPELACYDLGLIVKNYSVNTDSKSKTPRDTREKTPMETIEKTPKDTEKTPKYTEKTLKDTPNDAEKTPKDMENTPRNTEKMSRDMEKTQRDREKTQRDTEKTPKGTEKTQKDNEKTPKSMEKTPKDTENTPKDTEKTPKDTEKTPKDMEKTPKDTEKTPKDTEKTPRDTEKTQSDTEKTQRDTEKTPKDTEKTPRDTERTQRDTEKTPKDTEKTQRDTERMPKDTEKTPKDNEKTPKDNEKTPKNTEKTPKDTEKTKGNEKTPKDTEKELKSKSKRSAIQSYWQMNVWEPSRSRCLMTLQRKISIVSITGWQSVCSYIPLTLQCVGAELSMYSAVDQIILRTSLNNLLRRVIHWCPTISEVMCMMGDICHADQAMKCVIRLKVMLVEDESETYTPTATLCRQVEMTHICVKQNLQSCGLMDTMLVRDELVKVMIMVNDQCKLPVVNPGVGLKCANDYLDRITAVFSGVSTTDIYESSDLLMCALEFTNALDGNIRSQMYNIILYTWNITYQVLSESARCRLSTNYLCVMSHVRGLLNGTGDLCLTTSVNVLLSCTSFSNNSCSDFYQLLYKYLNKNVASVQSVLCRRQNNSCRPDLAMQCLHAFNGLLQVGASTCYTNICSDLDTALSCVRRHARECYSHQVQTIGYELVFLKSMVQYHCTNMDWPVVVGFEVSGTPLTGTCRPELAGQCVEDFNAVQVSSSSCVAHQQLNDCLKVNLAICSLPQRIRTIFTIKDSQSFDEQCNIDLYSTPFLPTNIEAILHLRCFNEFIHDLETVSMDLLARASISTVTARSICSNLNTSICMSMESRPIGLLSEISWIVSDYRERFCNMTATVTSKPGHCPYQGPIFGQCDLVCFGDFDCPGITKCCGCPRVCTNPQNAGTGSSVFTYCAAGVRIGEIVKSALLHFVTISFSVLEADKRLELCSELEILLDEFALLYHDDCLALTAKKPFLQTIWAWFREHYGGTCMNMLSYTDPGISSDWACSIQQAQLCLFKAKKLLHYRIHYSRDAFCSVFNQLMTCIKQKTDRCPVNYQLDLDALFLASDLLIETMGMYCGSLIGDIRPACVLELECNFVSAMSCVKYWGDAIQGSNHMALCRDVQNDLNCMAAYLTDCGDSGVSSFYSQLARSFPYYLSELEQYCPMFATMEAELKALVYSLQTKLQAMMPPEVPPLPCDIEKAEICIAQLINTAIMSENELCRQLGVNWQCLLNSVSGCSVDRLSSLYSQYVSQIAFLPACPNLDFSLNGIIASVAAMNNVPSAVCSVTDAYSCLENFSLMLTSPMTDTQFCGEARRVEACISGNMRACMESDVRNLYEQIFSTFPLLMNRMNTICSDIDLSLDGLMLSVGLQKRACWSWGPMKRHQCSLTKIMAECIEPFWKNPDVVPSNICSIREETINCIRGYQYGCSSLLMNVIYAQLDVRVQSFKVDCTGTVDVSLPIDEMLGFIDCINNVMVSMQAQLTVSSDYRNSGKICRSLSDLSLCYNDDSTMGMKMYPALLQVIDSICPVADSWTLPYTESAECSTADLALMGYCSVVLLRHVAVLEHLPLTDAQFFCWSSALYWCLELTPPNSCSEPRRNWYARLTSSVASHLSAYCQFTGPCNRNKAECCLARFASSWLQVLDSSGDNFPHYLMDKTCRNAMEALNCVADSTRLCHDSFAWKERITSLIASECTPYWQQPYGPCDLSKVIHDCIPKNLLSFTNSSEACSSIRQARICANDKAMMCENEELISPFAQIMQSYHEYQQRFCNDISGVNCSSSNIQNTCLPSEFIIAMNGNQSYACMLIPKVLLCLDNLLAYTCAEQAVYIQQYKTSMQMFYNISCVSPTILPGKDNCSEADILVKCIPDMFIGASLNIDTLEVCRIIPAVLQCLESYEVQCNVANISGYVQQYKQSFSLIMDKFCNRNIYACSTAKLAEDCFPEAIRYVNSDILCMVIKYMHQCITSYESNCNSLYVSGAVSQLNEAVNSLSTRVGCDSRGQCDIQGTQTCLIMRMQRLHPRICSSFNAIAINDCLELSASCYGIVNGFEQAQQEWFKNIPTICGALLNCYANHLNALDVQILRSPIDGSFRISLAKGSLFESLRNDTTGFMFIEPPGVSDAQCSNWQTSAFCLQQQFDLLSSGTVKVSVRIKDAATLLSNIIYGRACRPFTTDCAYPVNCFANPCDVTSCKEYPMAECSASYCGGCYADYYVNGRLVDCNGCNSWAMIMCVEDYVGHAVWLANEYSGNVPNDRLCGDFEGAILCTKVFGANCDSNNEVKVQLDALVTELYSTCKDIPVVNYTCVKSAEQCIGDVMRQFSPSTGFLDPSIVCPAYTSSMQKLSDCARDVYMTCGWQDIFHFDTLMNSASTVFSALCNNGSGLYIISKCLANYDVVQNLMFGASSSDISFQQGCSLIMNTAECLSNAEFLLLDIAAPLRTFLNNLSRVRPYIKSFCEDALPQSCTFDRLIALSTSFLSSFLLRPTNTLCSEWHYVMNSLAAIQDSCSEYLWTSLKPFESLFSCDVAIATMPPTNIECASVQVEQCIAVMTTSIASTLSRAQACRSLLIALQCVTDVTVQCTSDEISSWQSLIRSVANIKTGSEDCSMPRLTFVGIAGQIEIQNLIEPVSISFSVEENPREYCRQTANFCYLDVSLIVPSQAGQGRRCLDGTDVPAILFTRVSPGACVLRVDADNWDQVQTFTLQPSVLGRFNLASNLLRLELRVQLIESGQPLHDPFIQAVMLVIPGVMYDPTCSVFGDPHITAFDQSYYSVYDEGEYVLYRHRTQPFAVHGVFQRCMNEASCVCAIAVQSGNDVFVMDYCLHNGQQAGDRVFDTNLYLNGELTPGTYIMSEDSGMTYKILLPTGGLIQVKLVTSIGLMNVQIRPSPLDLSQTVGLCGTFNFSQINGLEMANGNFATRSNFPQVFSDSWRVTLEDSIWFGIESSIDTLVTLDDSSYCTCVTTGGGRACDSSLIQTCDLHSDDFSRPVLNSILDDLKPLHDRFRIVCGIKKHLAGSELMNDFYISRAVQSQIFLPERPALNFRFSLQTLNWPLTGWTSAQARQYCSSYFSQAGATSMLISQCISMISEQARAALELSCIQDIQVINGLAYIEATLNALLSKCSDSAMLDYETSLGESGRAVSLLTSICQYWCSTNDRCLAGTCQCDLGRQSSSCTLRTGQAIVTSFKYSRACYLTDGHQCGLVTVLGHDFVNTSSLQCFIQPVQLSAGSIIRLGNRFAVATKFVSFSAVECQFSSLDVTLTSTLAYGVYISVTNTVVQDMSTEFLYIIYDQNCYNCDSVTDQQGCMKKPDMCVIDGTCYQQGAVRSSVESNMICDPAQNGFDWSLAQTCDLMQAEICVAALTNELQQATSQRDRCTAVSSARTCIYTGSAPCTSTEKQFLENSISQVLVNLGIQCDLAIQLDKFVYYLTEGGPDEYIEFMASGSPQDFCRASTVQCQLSISVNVTHQGGDSVPRCLSGRPISQLIVGRSSTALGYDYCTMSIGSNWADKQSVPIRARIDGRYDGTQQVLVSLTGSLAEDGLVTWTKGLASVTVYIANKDDASVCASMNDPHIVAFDSRSESDPGQNRYLNVFHEGEFILYRHKTLPFEVRAIYQRCSTGDDAIASCTCAVMVRSGDDVFVVNRCRLLVPGTVRSIFDSLGDTQLNLQIAQPYINGELTPGTTFVTEAEGRIFKISLPIGTYVEIQSTLTFLNVWIQPSALDFDNTEGLCGSYDNNPYNDLQMPDGTIYDLTGLIEDNVMPVEYALSWRVNPEDSLLEGVASTADNQFTHTPYCTCPSQSSQATGAFVKMCEETLLVEPCDMSIAPEMTTKDFLSKAASTLYVRKRRAGETPLDRLDIDLNYVPKKAKWPTVSGWSLETASKYCNDLFNTNLTVKCREVTKSNYSMEIKSCIEDIQLSDSTEWALSALDLVRNQCVREVRRTMNLPSSVVHEITALSCLSNCNNHGHCMNGTCFCSDDFIGVDCSVTKVTAPLARNLDSDSFCDITHDPSACQTITIIGENFVRTKFLTCHFENVMFESLEGTLSRSYELRSHRAHFKTSYMVECDMMALGGEVEMDTKQALQGMIVSISNMADIRTASKPLLYVAYDSSCFQCDWQDQPKCVVKAHACVINNQCFTQDDVDPDEECNYCQPDSDNRAWSRRPSDICSKRIKTNQAGLSSTEHIVIGISVATILVIAIAVVVFLLRSRRSRLKQYADDLQPGPGNDTRCGIVNSGYANNLFATSASGEIYLPRDNWNPADEQMGSVRSSHSSIRATKSTLQKLGGYRSIYNDHMSPAQLTDVSSVDESDSV